MNVANLEQILKLIRDAEALALSPNVSTLIASIRETVKDPAGLALVGALTAAVAAPNFATVARLIAALRDMASGNAPATIGQLYATVTDPLALAVVADVRAIVGL